VLQGDVLCECAYPSNSPGHKNRLCRIAYRRVLSSSSGRPASSGIIISSVGRLTWGGDKCLQVHLTNFILLMFVLSDLQVVMDVTTNRTFSLLECYLIAFAGVVAGYFKVSGCCPNPIHCTRPGISQLPLNDNQLDSSSYVRARVLLAFWPLALPCARLAAPRSSPAPQSAAEPVACG
jgi:hypothetical protein